MYGQAWADGAMMSSESSAATRPYLVATASGCGVGVTVNGQAQPALADPGGLINRAAKAALAGHPGSLGPAPVTTTHAPAAGATSLPPPAGP